MRATCISSISLRRIASRCAAAWRLYMQGFAPVSRWSTAHFFTAQQGEHILSFSPELFFRIDGQDGERRITTKPMKGTAARGRTTRGRSRACRVAPQRPQKPRRKFNDRRLAAQRSWPPGEVWYRAHGRDVCGRALFNTLANDLDRERRIAIRM